MSDKYVCKTYPCIHVAVDYRRKKFAAFIETADEGFFYIRANEVIDAARKIEELLRKHFREAVGDEIDDIARRELGLERIEFVEEEIEE